ncbi:MAG TPA: transcription termination/antitermination NusG family protein [Phycisphaerae bacterium]|nr:transcription termination/antitermination NusG family protein [Phycisphaerae bacterium]HRR83734.1 transcription termination/antitermination NusG family protein [Phycisphaerae bacterium]
MADSHSGECVFSGVGGESDALVIRADLPGRWYVAHTRARNEKILAEELSRFGIYNYLPLALHVTRSSRTNRISRSLIPIFPGYVFFHGSEEQRYLALRTNRVANVLDVVNQNQLLAELRQVHRLLQERGDFAVIPRIQKGQWGRIIAGPLVGLEGIVVRYAGRYRVCMNVTILGQCVGVEVDYDLVEPIDAPAYLTTRP